MENRTIIENSNDRQITKFTEFQHSLVCYIDMQYSRPLYVRLNCAACRREAPASILQPAQSMLDSQFRDLCPACIEHKAEALPALVRTVNKAGWKELTDEIRRTVRVWDMEEYVTVPAWAERMSRQQLVTLKETEEPLSDPEDQALLERLRKKQQELATPKRQTTPQRKRQTKRSRWLQRVVPG